MRNPIQRISTKLWVALAVIVGLAAGSMHLRGSKLAVSLVGLVALVLLLQRQRREQDHRDFCAQQRRIDREYRLSLESKNVILYLNEQVETEFRWHGIVEVQRISRDKSLPRAFWKLTNADGDFLIPNGGRYAEEFEEKFIFALPGYFKQRTVAVPAPEGYDRAVSHWRRDDPYPKQDADE